MTRGRAATTEPFDISAVSRSDELFDALATRRLPDTDDPAAGLLAALVADVDRDAPPLPVPGRAPCGGSRRRGVRAVVTFGVAAVVLTSAGAAAAGNGVGAMDTPHGPGKPRSAERSNENVRHRQPTTGPVIAGRRSGPRHGDSPAPSPDDHPSRQRTPKPNKPNKPENGNKPPKGRSGRERTPPATTTPPPVAPDPGPPSGVREPIDDSPQPESR